MCYIARLHGHTKCITAAVRISPHRSGYIAKAGFMHAIHMCSRQQQTIKQRQVKRSRRQGSGGVQGLLRRPMLAQQLAAGRRAEA